MPWGNHSGSGPARPEVDEEDDEDEEEVVEDDEAEEEVLLVEVDACRPADPSPPSLQADSNITITVTKTRLRHLFICSSLVAVRATIDVFAKVLAKSSIQPELKMNCQNARSEKEEPLHR